MSLYGSMFSGVSGLNAQGSAIAMISDNVSNINTDGYKGSEAAFQTLVTSSSGSIGYSSGGVIATAFKKIDKQGLVRTTGRGTDLAISGEGFFVVNRKADLKGDYLYTRAGAFNTDDRGNLRNNAGYFLLAWALDSEGRLPGEPGNLDTTSNALLDSLKVVNVNSISGNASQTTLVELGINLKSSEKLLKGTGDTFVFPSTSINYKINALDVIVPDDATAGIELNEGNTIVLTPSNPGTAYTFTYGGFSYSDDVTGGILGSTSVNGVFTGATADDGFTITTNVAGLTKTSTYTFVAASPTVAKGEFNSLSSLAEAISRTHGLSSRIQGGRLYVTNIDADQAITFTNTGAGGTNFTAAGNLNLANVAAAGGAVDRFATLQDLANKIKAQTGLMANVKNPLDASSVEFYARDPLGTLDIAATGSAAVAPSAAVSTANGVLAQFGIAHASGYQYLASYDSADSTKNLSSGMVQAQFSRNVRVFDAFGTGHDFQVSFGKIDDNVWSAEIYALDKTQIISSRTDGQIAAGTIEFNGDGTLRNVSASLSIPIEILWTNEALPSSITFDWGTAGEVAGTVGAVVIGKADGLRQLDSDYLVDYVSQNGISAGLLSGIEIDASGFIIARFSNGTSRKIYRVALADFTSPNKLESRAGNVFAETTDSGNYNLKRPDTGGIGKIEPGTLEQANVELSDELTRMIIAQRGYQANSKVIKTVNEMLEDLNRIF